MRKTKMIIGLLMINFIISCHDKPGIESKHIVVQDVTIEEVNDDIGPPPPNFHSDFKSLKGWLQNLCHNNKPKKSIADFNFGLFESPEDNIIYLVGLNKYQNKNSTVTRIEFEPANKYFKLPNNEYGGLNRQQLLGKLTSQLKSFIQTDEFKKSFLSKSNTITTTFAGTIWSR